MAKLYVLLKKKGSKRPLGIIPSKKGVSIQKLRKYSKTNKVWLFCKNYYRSTIKRLIETMRPRKVKSRKTRVKRRIKKRRRNNGRYKNYDKVCYWSNSFSTYSF